ncbi:MAG: GNAT family N-acetyltransferase [Clostridia bacterium]|nr:GNAT family N-acetyltransferase [Clostridia bacterium]
MILRHAREPIDDLPVENTFEAVDERSGSLLGSCAIYVSRSPELFPARPIRIYMDIQGTPAPDALLGAAVARAKELGLQSGEPCRIFTQAEPDDIARKDALELFGFMDNDGLVRMQLELPGDAPGQLPFSSVIVKDDLDDPIEQGYFLERVNQLYNESYDDEWLAEFRGHDGFTRILIVSPAGMLGEAAIWQEEGCGVIGWLHTAKKWRRKGVCRRIVEIACQEFENRGLRCATAEIQARIPNLLHIIEHLGFRQAELILRYPGFDMN